MKQNVATLAPPPLADPPSRGDEARARLLEAGLDVFSMVGYEGATTRALAARAGVNISAIKYYFGNKEGLYQAVVEHMVSLLEVRMGPNRQRLEQALTDSRLPRAEARALLVEFLEAFARTCIGPEHFNRVMMIWIRAQLDGKAAFETIYVRIIQRIFAPCAALVARLLDCRPDDNLCRLHVLTMVGQVIIFRVSRRATLKTLGWKDFGPRELAEVCDVIRHDVEGRFPL